MTKSIGTSKNIVSGDWRRTYLPTESIRSMPRDYCVQALAQLLQGYGSGVILELFRDVMTPDRIVRLNVTPLSPAEFLEPLIEKGIEPISVEDYQEYMKFCLQNSPLKAKREEFAIINTYREVVYRKMGKQKG